MTEETIDHYAKPQPSRPAFLVVLCVLTWIVSAWVLVTAPFNYFFSNSQSASTLQTTLNDAMMEIAEEDPNTAQMLEGFMTSVSETVSKQIEFAGWIALTDILVAILSAQGAFFMFKLRKTGFLIYVGAKILSLISILAFVGVNLLTMGMVTIGGFVGLIMVVLYAVNRKHMS